MEAHEGGSAAVAVPCSGCEKDWRGCPAYGVAYSDGCSSKRLLWECKGTWSRVQGGEQIQAVPLDILIKQQTSVNFKTHRF